MTIWKYDLQLVLKQDVAMPSGSRVLCVQAQNNKPYLWALVNPEAELCLRGVNVYTTGEKCLDAVDLGLMEYAGTFQLDCGRHVYHVFIGKDR